MVVGMSVTQRPHERAAALASVREGRLYDLGTSSARALPVFRGRHFRQTLVTTAHHANAGSDEAAQTGLGDNNVNCVIELIGDDAAPDAPRRLRGARATRERPRLRPPTP
jgi:hypothetical protein